MYFANTTISIAFSGRFPKGRGCKKFGGKKFKKGKNLKIGIVQFC